MGEAELGFTGWTTLLISAAGCLLAGFALQAGGVRGWRRFRYALGLGPGLGMGVVSLVLFFGRLIGLGRPGFGEILLVFAGLAAGIFGMSARSRRRTGAVPEEDAPDSLIQAPVRAPLVLRVIALLALLLTIGFVIESYRVLSRAWPEGTWDAVAIWNVRARFLERGYEDVSTLFKAVDRSSHPHYPLLLPGAVATQYVLAGEDDAWVPEATGLAFLLGLGLLTFAVVADSGLLAYAALATAMLWGTPILLKWGGAQVGDIPLAYFFLGAVAALASQLPGRAGGNRLARLPRLPPILGGVFLGLLAWTKNEGTLMALVLLGLYAAWVLAFGEGGPGDRKRWRPLTGFAAGAVPGLAAVFLFKRLWAPESGLDTFLQGELAARALSLERWWIPTQEILRRLIPVEQTYGWGLVWPALEMGVLLACWVHWRARRPWTSFWGAALLATVLCWIPIYVVTPYDQRWHISGSLDRLFLQVYPAVIAGVFLHLGVAAASDPWTEEAQPLWHRFRRAIRLPLLRPLPQILRLPATVFLPALLTAALAVKVAAVLLAVPAIWLMPDELLYMATAYDFTHWGGAGVPHPDFLYYPPLASLLIAPLHRMGLTPPQVYTLSLILFNVLLLSTVPAAYLLLRRLYGARSRLLPVLLALAAPCTALVLMSEPLYITLFVWLLYLYVRMLQDRKSSDHLLAGLLLAGMVLTRQVGVFVLAAVAAAAVADLALGPETRRKLRLYAWTIVPPVLAAVAWRLIAGELRGGEGGSNLPYFLAVAVATPVKLVLGSARRLISELGYVSLTTYGIALPAVLWGLFRRGGGSAEDTHRRRLFSGVVFGSLFLTASASAVFMWYARFHYLPRYDMYGRYVDYFAIPLLVLALGTYWEVRRDASDRERWRLAAWTFLLNAAFLLVIPERFFPESLKHQVVPNSLGIAWLLEMVRIFGSWIRWLVPPAAALLAAFLASPAYVARRGLRYAVVAGLAVLSLFNFQAGAKAVSVESHGSLEHASRISDYIALNPELFPDGLYLDYPGIGYRRSEPAEMAAQHAFIYRVLADHVDKVIAGGEPERFHDRMPVLSRRAFPGWRVLAEWPWVQYRIYAPASGGG